MESLYPKILGPQWDALHPSIKNLHAFQDRLMKAHGEFHIHHGKNLLARGMARLLRMPKANRKAKVSLEVMEKKLGEQWLRTIEGREFPSLQGEHSPGVLSERVGIMVLHLSLRVHRGCLQYENKACCIRLFGKTMPVPSWLSPKIIASECPTPKAGRCEINVEINFPGLGTILRYGGWLQKELTQP